MLFRSDSITDLGCGDEILPGMISTVNLNVSWKSSQYSPLIEEIYLITYIDEEPSISVVKLTPDLPQYVNSSWYMNYDLMMSDITLTTSSDSCSP